METFNELNLNPSLLSAIQELGYTKPSPIQAQALPILLGEPTDFLGLAATGTGKTAAFAIPLIERTNSTRRAVQTLVLCPTRELALQVSGQINLLGKNMGVKALPIYGGASFSEQLQGLKRGVTVVVGTPGRVIDHMDRGTLHLDQVDTVILDEADEMISMGLKDDLEKILSTVPAGLTHTWLFSATMGAEVRKVAEKYLKNPKQVQVNKTEMLPEGIQQLYYVTQEANKPEVLCKLIDAADDFYGIVFCQTKSLVTDLTQYLRGRGYPVDCLHGDMDQSARERTMKAYRDRKVTLLICTDVASRGLDVKDITHVINYSIPRELDNYVHRIGRTARSGKEGYAMSLVTASHRALIPRIERLTKRRMLEGKIPTRKEIGLKKVAKVLSHFESQVSFPRALETMGDAWKASISKMTPDEITGRFLVMMYPEIFAERAQLNEGKSMQVQVASASARHSTSTTSSSESVIIRRGASSSSFSSSGTSGAFGSAGSGSGERGKRDFAGPRGKPREYSRDRPRKEGGDEKSAPWKKKDSASRYSAPRKERRT